MLINDASITGSLIVNASSSFQDIAVSGNILPGTNNVYNLGSVDKFFKEIFVSTGSINFVDNTGIKTTITSVAGGGIQIGSVQITTSSISFVDSTGSVTQNIAQSSSAGTTSDYTPTASFNEYTQSFSSSVSSSITIISSSVTTTITSLSSSVSESVTSLSSSLTSVNTTQNDRLGSIESTTGSYSKLSGGNTFSGTQIVSASMYVTGDLVVYGSSSIQYISASSVSIGNNIVQLNTANPAVRFAGLSIIDSGSIGGSGSFLYDSVHDEFIFVHRGNGTNITSSHFVLGPETYDSLGNETYLTNNRLPKGTGKEHLVNSNITDTGTLITLGSNTTITGTLVASGTTIISSSAQITGITNAQLSNSTISGKSLGTNLDTLTIGTGLSGTSYNGSSAITIANSGVTSNVAGTGVTVSGATGAVTISIGQSVATSATPTFGKVFLTTNLATGIANNSFNTSKAILGNIHMQNGDGASGDNKQAAITFQGGNSSEAQAGIYVSNNNAIGTAMGFATTDSYATGPQVFMTATNTGLVNFPRAVPTYAGTSLVYNSGTWGISISGNAATATNAYGARFQFDSYGNWTPGGAGGAAIVNSNEAQYQALMIVGNSSAGGVRVVKMWDNVQVQGAMSATADITAYFSDGRLKENLQPLKNAISKITTLTGYTYNTNALGKKLLNNENVSDSKVGLIAQDLQKVLPEAVKLAPFDNDGKNNSKSGENYLTIQYEKVVPLLIEAIKEQQIKIDNLTIEVENLKKPKGL